MLFLEIALDGLKADWIADAQAIKDRDAFILDVHSSKVLDSRVVIRMVCLL